MSSLWVQQGQVERERRVLLEKGKYLYKTNVRVE